MSLAGQPTRRRLAGGTVPQAASGRLSRGLPAALLLGVALLGAALPGCALKFAEGQALEDQGRWEEAMLAYRDAVIDDPDDPEYREALARAEKVVARDNLERYRAFLAQKAFRKAYARLQDAARQDPAYPPVREELAKWDRVLVSGQVQFAFDVAQSSITLADEITLLVRINSPNPGETIDATVDIETGTFFAEDLLYDQPAELLALYTINSIGVELRYGRNRVRQFTTRDYQRFISIRSPVLGEVTGALALGGAAELHPVLAHRADLRQAAGEEEPAVPASNPRYSLRIEGPRIYVRTPDERGRTDFTPRYLYVNRKDRRILVDFGRYEVRLKEVGARWSLRRLPLGGRDYFPDFSRNIALQPYFFYREGVFSYVPAGPG